MILKGNIRAGAYDLANHLLNDRDNDKVELASVEGFVSDDLHGALAETYAMSSGTNCTKYLYSLSINPSQELTREEYAHAIDKISQKLGLADQPRAVVFHVKDGREHCHVAYSRIDADSMQAVAMPFDKKRLREVARELVRDFGHEMPKHLGEDRGVDRFKDKFNQPTLAEQGQAKRSGITIEERRDAVSRAYEMADNAKAFRHALAEEGYILARGDKTNKRGEFTPVLVDHAGEVHGLRQQLAGVKAKEIRTKLDLDNIADLPTVQEAKEQIAELTRHNARVATQERPDSPDRVQEAQDALSALKDAHAAEMKALKGAKIQTMKGIREREAEELEYARKAVKDAYKPEWADLYRQQREQVEAIHAQFDSTGKRVKALLTGQADAFQFENRSTMANMFSFIIKGEVNLKKLEKHHARERRELGDMQRLAERSEVREIKEIAANRRADAQQEHADHEAYLKLTYADEISEAVKNLEYARELSERDGTDLSQGEVADRAGKSWDGGFSEQGFSRQGFDTGGDRERDDDDERFIKPPGQSFTP